MSNLVDLRYSVWVGVGVGVINCNIFSLEVIFRVSLHQFGEEYLKSHGEEIPLKSAGFDNLLDMFTSLFEENPFDGLFVSLSNFNDGLYIDVRTRAEGEKAEADRPPPSDEL